MSLLRKEASKQNLSINSLILRIIEQKLGVSQETKKTVYHELDYLAGTWDDEDKKEFEENTKSFEKIDSELWQ